MARAVARGSGVRIRVDRWGHLPRPTVARSAVLAASAAWLREVPRTTARSLSLRIRSTSWWRRHGRARSQRCARNHSRSRLIVPARQAGHGAGSYCGGRRSRLRCGYSLEAVRRNSLRVCDAALKQDAASQTSGAARSASRLRSSPPQKSPLPHPACHANGSHEFVALRRQSPVKRWRVVGRDAAALSGAEARRTGGRA